MNTIYSTLALLVSLATSVQAQDTSVHQSNAGIKGGYNLAAVRFDGSGETGQPTDFILGSMASHSLVKAFLSNPNYCILNKATKLKMLMVRLPKTRLH
jgi:hypothetical protein